MIGDGGGARHLALLRGRAQHVRATGCPRRPRTRPRPTTAARFPRPTIQDNVRAQHRLVTEHLGITGIELVIGGSMGAFQAFQWGLSHPDLVRRIMPTGGALAGEPALLRVPGGRQGGAAGRCRLRRRRLRALRPNAGCERSAGSTPGGGCRRRSTAQSLFRQMGFDDARCVPRRLLGGVLRRRSTPTTCSASSTPGSAPTSRRPPGYDGDLARALGDIRAKAVLAPGEKDLYFPPEDMAWEAEQMPDAELAVIPGVVGALLGLGGRSRLQRGGAADRAPPARRGARPMRRRRLARGTRGARP